MDSIIQTIKDIDESVKNLLALRLSLIDLARFKTGDLLDIEIPRPIPRPYELLTVDEVRKAVRVSGVRRSALAAKEGNSPDDPIYKMARSEQHLRNDLLTRAFEIGREAGVFE
jgi:hypothetical protein